jgi:hypothetical protein
MMDRSPATDAIIACLALALLAGCGGSPTAEPTVIPTASAGHVIHVELYVPLTSDAPGGSPCDMAALRSTGPGAATIPGSHLQFLRWADRVNGKMEVIGEGLVPLGGTVAGAISDDPNFPTACLFTLDVPTTMDTDVYAYALGSIYFPVPAILRQDLEAAEWVARIGVNPQ